MTDKLKVLESSSKTKPVYLRSSQILQLEICCNLKRLKHSPVTWTSLLAALTCRRLIAHIQKDMNMQKPPPWELTEAIHTTAIASKGLSPSADIAEHIGKRRKFEIHHINPINEGGSVYDISNLTLLTPKQHIDAHSKKGETP
ncbi:HNH endonuclease signature motif containing protein [Pseudomonas sp. NPDC087690]|jgi:hypothetical protein|uniref:HNH endonuclease signature motif containing protein n=1 Tax=Pseudomonas sp. NPDC087690 TaxID=3364446 RepID=UPI00380BD200